MGLSTELRSTRNLLKNAKENTDIIRKQNEHTKLELAKANMSLKEADKKLNETLAELEKLKGKFLGKRAFTAKTFSIKLLYRANSLNVI